MLQAHAPTTPRTTERPVIISARRPSLTDQVQRDVVSTCMTHKRTIRSEILLWRNLKRHAQEQTTCALLRHDCAVLFVYMKLHLVEIVWMLSVVSDVRGKSVAIPV